jgi:hypothetical protein
MLFGVAEPGEIMKANAKKNSARTAQKHTLEVESTR